MRICLANSIMQSLVENFASQLPTRTADAGPLFWPLFFCFPHDISKSDAAKITKLDIKMFNYKS